MSRPICTQHTTKWKLTNCAFRASVVNKLETFNADFTAAIVGTHNGPRVHKNNFKRFDIPCGYQHPPFALHVSNLKLRNVVVVNVPFPLILYKNVKKTLM